MGISLFKTLLETSGLKKDSDWTRFLVQCLALTFILHLIAAVRSSGFYHVDEHFQIIEFMNYKLGRSPAIDLPLEYGQLMRPWLMSAIFAGFTWVWRALGVTSPFDWALGYRLCCAGLGFLSTAGLMLSCYLWFPIKTDQRFQWRTLAVLALTFIWYLPALHARHSSENVSGSVFFIAISLIVLCLPSRRSDSHPTQSTSTSYPDLLALLVGLLFGLAFEFRYQTGFMILGAIFWLVLMARIPFRFLLILVAGIVAPVILGTLADYWGYGQWTFAPWNYVKYNLVQNHVSDSDVTPWWDYFRRALTESWPPLGLLLLVSFPIAWLRNPKHLLTWSLFPLFFIHEIIGHKELRFLFPLIHAGPVLLIMSVQDMKSVFRSRVCKGVTVGIVGLNAVALVFTTVLPAWSPIRFYEKLYFFKPYGFQLYTADKSLFDFGGAKMNFYKPTHLPLIQLHEISEIIPILKNQHRPVWIFTPRLNLSEEIKPYCRIEFSTLPAWPAWIERLNPLGVVGRVTNWTLHRCETKKQASTNNFS
jgi:phosphatidylinositol glycan class B